MTKKVLITGASGLIGSNLVDLLLANNYHVVGLAHRFPLKKVRIPQFSNKNYTTVQGDILDGEFIKKTLKVYNPNYIIHLAAQAIVGDSILNADETFDVNIKGTWNLLQASKELNQLELVVIASSDKAYGTHDKLPYKESDQLNAIHPYDLSKKVTELLAQSYHKTYNLPITITRCGNVFGPYDLNKSRIVPDTINACIKGEKIILRSDGKQQRCYVYVKDISNAYLEIIKAPVKNVNGEVFNFGNSDSVSVIKMVETICKKMNVNPSEEIVIQNTSKYEIQNQSLDCSKAKRILCWEQKYDLDTALNETIDWYSKNSQLLSSNF